MNVDRVLVLMFWARVGGVFCDQAVLAWTEHRLLGGVVWSALGVALAGVLTGMYLRARA